MDVREYREITRLAGKKKAHRGGTFEDSLSPEDRIQKRVCGYLDGLGVLYCAVPNGGKRGKFAAYKAKMTGEKPGVPDLLIFEARGGYHGLAIELKSPGGKPTEYQREWQRRLGERGWRTVIVMGKTPEAIHRECVSIIDGYMV